MTGPLEKECACFQRRLPDLLRSSEGKYVLIRGDDVVATCETERDAIRHGFDALGPVPFLVRQVRRADQTRELPSGTAPSAR